MFMWHALLVGYVTLSSVTMLSFGQTASLENRVILPWALTRSGTNVSSTLPFDGPECLGLNPNDVLIFQVPNNSRGIYNVHELPTLDASEACNFSSAVQWGNDSLRAGQSVSIPLVDREVGSTLYFACEIRDHCSRYSMRVQVIIQPQLNVLWGIDPHGVPYNPRRISVQRNDVVTFMFDTTTDDLHSRPPLHTFVRAKSKEAFDSCSENEDDYEVIAGPGRGLNATIGFAAAEVGVTQYFFDSITENCENGLKVAIDVVDTWFECPAPSPTPKVNPGHNQEAVSANAVDPMTIVSISIVAVFVMSLLVFASIAILGNRASESSPFTSWDEGEHNKVLLAGLSFVNFLAHSSFVSHYAILHGFNDVYVQVALSFFVVSIVVNLCLLVRTILSESQYPQTRVWYNKRPKSVSLVAVLSLTNVEVLSILCSRISKASDSLFNAPFSPQTQRRAYWLGLANNFLADIPISVICVLLLHTDGFAPIAVVALTTSILALCFGLLRKTFAMSLYYLGCRPHPCAHLIAIGAGGEKRDFASPIGTARNSLDFSIPTERTTPVNKETSRPSPTSSKSAHRFAAPSNITHSKGVSSNCDQGAPTKSGRAASTSNDQAAPTNYERSRGVSRVSGVTFASSISSPPHFSPHCLPPHLLQTREETKVPYHPPPLPLETSERDIHGLDSVPEQLSPSSIISESFGRRFARQLSGRLFPRNLQITHSRRGAGLFQR